MTKYSFLLVFLVFLSCTDEDMTFKIGGDFVDVKTNVTFIDTLTVRSYTVMMDSIRTSGLDAPAILVGKYFDPEFGNISSQSYFRVGLPTTAYTIPKDAVFDSIQLILLYNDYSTGDTTKNYTINVHRLDETMKPNDDDYFYNTSTFSYKTELFGSASMIPEPNTNDTLWIDLNNTFGNELFNLLLDKDDKVVDNVNFLNYLSGFVLSGVETNDAILGFKFPKPSQSNQEYPTMRLYYHYFDYQTVSKHLDFPVRNSDYSLQFNHIKLTEPVVAFPTGQRSKLPSSATNNKSYILAGVGLVTRLEIPYLKSLLDLHDNIKILKAELQVEPIKNSYKVFSLPEKTSLYISDDHNRFESAIVDNNNSVQTGDLQIDEVFEEETWYTFDVTSFCETKLKALEDDSTPSLLLTVTPENLYMTLDRLIIINQRSSENRVKLKVYYMYYE